MMRRYFLIDYENTNGKGLRGISMLSPSDVVYVFYTTLCKNINMEYIENFRGRFVCKKVQMGDQAVDKHILAKMGQLSAKDNIDIVVISKDKGYDQIINEIDRKKKIVRHQSIANFLKIPDVEFENEPVVQKEDNQQPVAKEKDVKIPELSPKKRIQLNNKLSQSIAKYRKQKKVKNIEVGWILKNIFEHLEDDDPFTSISKIMKKKGKNYEKIYVQIIEPILMVV